MRGRGFLFASSRFGRVVSVKKVFWPKAKKALLGHFQPKFFAGRIFGAPNIYFVNNFKIANTTNVLSLGKGEAIETTLAALQVVPEPFRSFANALVDICAYAGKNLFYFFQLKFLLLLVQEQLLGLVFLRLR